MRFCEQTTTHSYMLCPYIIEQTRKVMSVKVGSIFSIKSRTQRSVVLQTAVFTAHNKGSKSVPSEQRNVSILCDTGAQKSLITEECADRLGLKVLLSERDSLLGFGQKRSANNTYDIV